MKIKLALAFIFLASIVIGVKAKENLRTETEEKGKFSIYEFLTKIFWGTKDSSESPKHEISEKEKNQIIHDANSRKPSKVNYNETPKIFKNKVEEKKTEFMNVNMNYDLSPEIKDFNHNVIFESNNNDKKIFKGEKSVEDSFKPENSSITFQKVEQLSSLKNKTERKLEKISIPHLNLTIYHSVPKSEAKPTIHETVHEIAKKVLDIKENKTIANPFESVKYVKTSFANNSKSMHFQEKSNEIYHSSKGPQIVFKSQKTDEFEPVSLVKRISQYSKEILKQANDPNYKPPMDLRALSAKNRGYSESPQLIRDVFEGSIAQVITAHHVTEDKKALWRQPFEAHYKEVAFGNDNLDPMQTIIASKGVSVQVMKNKSDDKEPTFDGVENTVMKKELLDAKTVETFIPSGNQK